MITTTNCYCKRSVNKIWLYLTEKTSIILTIAFVQRSLRRWNHILKLLNVLLFPVNNITTIVPLRYTNSRFESYIIYSHNTHSGSRQWWPPHQCSCYARNRRSLIGQRHSFHHSMFSKRPVIIHVPNVLFLSLIHILPKHRFLRSFQLKLPTFPLSSDTYIRSLYLLTSSPFEYFILSSWCVQLHCMHISCQW